jgi:tRNA-dihydrouridine synthase B
MHIPIIGNGDIKDPHSARHFLDTWGVDGIMIGRASIGNPWIFKQIKHYFQTGELIKEPEISERAEVCKKHLQMSVAWKGERVAVFEMRRHYCTYFKGIRNFKPFRMQLVTAPTAQEVYDIIDEIRATDFQV